MEKVGGVVILIGCVLFVIGLILMIVSGFKGKNCLTSDDSCIATVKKIALAGGILLFLGIFSMIGTIGVMTYVSI